MRLDVSQKTFEKNSLTLDQVISFTNFEGFIDSLRSKIIQDILNPESNLVDIFGIDIPSLTVLKNPKRITYISDNYFIACINSREFTRYYTGSEKDFSKKNQINAYKLKLLEDLLNREQLNRTLFSLLLSFIKEKTSFLNFIKLARNYIYTNFNFSLATYIKANSLNLDEIDLSIEEKEQIKNDLYFVLTNFQEYIKEAPVCIRNVGDRKHYKYHSRNFFSAFSIKDYEAFKTINVIDLMNFNF